MGAAVRERVRQRVYELSEVNELPRAAGAMRRATPADLQLLADWYSQFLREVDAAHPANPEEWASVAVASRGPDRAATHRLSLYVRTEGDSNMLRVTSNMLRPSRCMLRSKHDAF